MKKFDIKRIIGLTELEAYVIEQAIDFHYEMDRIKQQLLENIHDYGKIQAIAKSAAMYETMNRMINFNKKVFENVCSEVLLKIINQDKFETKYNWSSDEDKVIPKCILPNFNSYDNFINTNPKATIAKRLGATITA